jgi:enamine deaminase RidA (YjgF/YER057c/UK114 family)
MKSISVMRPRPHPPARTTVEAARLPKDSLVEIDAVALE